MVAFSAQSLLLLGLTALLTPSSVSCSPFPGPASLAVRDSNGTGSNPLATTFDGNIRKGAQLFLDAHPDANLIFIRATNPMSGTGRPLVDRPEDLLQIREQFIITEPVGTWTIDSNSFAPYGTWNTPERQKRGFSGAPYFSTSDLKYFIVDALAIARKAGVSGQISEIRIAPQSEGILTRGTPLYHIYFATVQIIINATTGQIVGRIPIPPSADATGTGPSSGSSSVATA